MLREKQWKNRKKEKKLIFQNFGYTYVPKTNFYHFFSFFYEPFPNYDGNNGNFNYNDEKITKKYFNIMTFEQKLTIFRD